MKKVEVLIVNKSNNALPRYETIGSAGMDIRANIDKPMYAHEGCTVLVPTGLYIALPIGYEFQVRPRSGLALKYSVTILNSPGTVDSDYRGEIGIIIHNAGNELFEIKNRDRICQIVLAEVIHAEWKELDEIDKLPSSNRGGGGFGSTGNK